MKVTSVEIFNLDADIGGFPWHPVLVRVNTDEGISGVGEVGLAYGTGHDAGFGMAKNIAESFIIGADPFHSEWMWENLFRRTFWGQGGGPVVFGGISAFDIAFWDIKGKALGVPIWKLLGGKTNPFLRTYASQVQSGWGKALRNCKLPPEFAEEAMKAVAEGYDCIKVDPCQNDEKGNRLTDLRKLLTNDVVRLVHDRLKAMRKAIGPDVDIIIELHSGTSANSAIQLGKIWEEFNCFFVEETTNYLNVDVQNRISSATIMPQAAGERLYTRWGFRPYFEKQALSVIQPDLCLAGGITEGKKICDFAHVYDVTVQCHVCGSPVSTATSLHLEAVIPNFQIHEHHTFALKPGNIEICKQDYQPVRGKFDIPDLPGLGIELNDGVVSRSPHIRVP
jgi:L-alanine-DL-glutamate epimerase-like enolase superfamily enzyme